MHVCGIFFWFYCLPGHRKLDHLERKKATHLNNLITTSGMIWVIIHVCTYLQCENSYVLKFTKDIFSNVRSIVMVILALASVVLFTYTKKNICSFW